MKIIDEKGRLFGKVNLIDFLVVLFLLCILPAFYFGYKIMTKKAVVEAPKEEFIEIEIDCLLVKLEPKILKLISGGDKELDENGRVTGEIIGLGQSGPYKYKFDIGKKEPITKEDPVLKQIETKLKLKSEIKQNKLYYKDKPIKIGSPLKFKTNEYNLTAVPLKEEEEEEEEEEMKDRMIDLYVTLKDLDEDMLKQISIGDKELDEEGRTIAQILSLGNIEDSSLELNLGRGNFVIGKQGSKKQISTEMRLKCKTGNENQLYFKGKKIEYSTPIEIKTDKYKVAGLVAKSFEITPPIKEKWILLQVKSPDVVPEVAKVVQKGDIEKNFAGKTTIRLNSIISNKPAPMLALQGGQIVGLNHPSYKELTLSLDVRCTEKEGVYYFKNHPIKMGNNIVFTTDLYSISGLIIGMEMR